MPETILTKQMYHIDLYLVWCAGLAYYLSQKVNPELTQQMKLLYEDELKRALEEDGSPSSSFITPKTYYPNV